MKCYYRPWSLTLAVALLLSHFPAQPAQAARRLTQPVPALVWGALTLDGLPAPDHTVVEARLNGVTYASAAVLSAEGQPGLYRLYIPGDDPATPGLVEGGQAGQIITLHVAGYFIAPTARWNAGEITQLNLTGALLTPTPSATTLPTPTPAPGATLTPAPTLAPPPAPTLAPPASAPTQWPGVTATPLAPPTGGPTVGAPVTYRVQPGDTLFSLARRFNLTVAALMAANNLYTTTIYPGQTLVIRSGTVPPGDLGGGEGLAAGRYVIRPGDTLFSIARRAGLSVSVLQAANGLRSSFIYAGQVLVIPIVSAAPPRAGTHVVQPGDTLFSIARSRGVSVSALMAANNLTSALIYPGQILSIPSP